MKISRPLEVEFAKNRKMKIVQMVMRFVSTYAQPRSRFGDIMLSGILSKACAHGELASLTTTKTEVVQKNLPHGHGFPIIWLADFMLGPFEIPSCVLDA